MQYDPNVQISTFATSESSLLTQAHRLTPIRRSREHNCSNAQRALVPVRFYATPLKSWDRLWNSSACGYADNKKDQASHQEQEEQEFRNPCRGSSDARKSKKRRHQCDY
jgi:hypothetical protein